MWLHAVYLIPQIAINIADFSKVRCLGLLMEQVVSVATAYGILKSLTTFFSWWSFRRLELPTPLHDLLNVRYIDRCVSFEWTISAVNFFSECGYFKRHKLGEGLLTIPHFPQHNSVTVNIGFPLASEQVNKYLGRKIVNAFLCFCISTHNANICYLRRIVCMYLQGNV